ncbi:MAG: Tetratricopeptide 2 repeat protein [Labilithrix sp.]|nr:Tetratricopeptide 2 repeat protein [Labilithrix sp.]
MRGEAGEPDEAESESRRFTPSIGLAHDSDAPNEAANEDFLFHLYRGSELLQDNRAHEAKEELERALHLQPHDAKGQDLLGVVYFRLGLYPRAIAIYEQLRRTSPRDPSLLLNLALCYLKTGQPAFARRDLELLLAINPHHGRAWGYLGLACERLGDLDEAERAFAQGGHAPMARRMAERRASQLPGPPPAEPSSPSREIRDAVAAVYEELDAGELSFELAKPASDSREESSPNSWRSVELGNMPSNDRREGSSRPGGRSPSIPQIGSPLSVGHRNTLMLGAVAASAIDNEELAALSRMPNSNPPAFVVDETGTPSLRRPGVAAVSFGASHAPARSAVGIAPAKRTLPPPADVPSGAAAEAPPAETSAAPTVVVHASGVALVGSVPAGGFAARLESLRASSSGLSLKVLERVAKGKPTGESFGGAFSPIALATGEGQLLLAPRPGRKLTAFSLGSGDGEDPMCFVREEVLLGFDGALTFENGKLAAGEGELVAVVQLRGTGTVVVEAIGEILTLDVRENAGMSVRREVVLGWFGRLVPRALAATEAPCGQRGLVAFAGEGRVLVASA